MAAPLKGIPDEIGIGGGDGSALWDGDGAPHHCLDAVVEDILSVRGTIMGHHGYLGEHPFDGRSVVQQFEAVRVEDTANSINHCWVDAFEVHEVLDIINDVSFDSFSLLVAQHLNAILKIGENLPLFGFCVFH